MGEDKFEQEVLPNILAAIQTARQSRMYSTLTLIFAENGGNLAIKLVTERDFKKK